MPAPEMNGLARKKKLLLIEAGVHRSMLELHGLRWRNRVTGLRDRLSTSGPLLLIGGTIGGWLLAGNWRRIAAALPIMWSLWKSVRR